MHPKSLVLTIIFVFVIGFLTGNMLLSNDIEDTQAVIPDPAPVTEAKPEEETSESPEDSSEKDVGDPHVPDEPQATVRVAYSKATNNSIINVRTGPGQNFEIIAKVEKGKPMIIIDEKDDWYRVRLEDGRLAWVASWIVDVREE